MNLLPFNQRMYKHIKRTLALSIMLVSVFTFGCKKEANEQPVPEKQIIFTAEQAQVLRSTNEFGIKMFNDLGDNFPSSKNLFISPLSIYFAMTMAYNGAAGETATEMANALGNSGLSKEEINTLCKELIEKLTGADKSVLMEIANSIWYRNTFPVKADFLTINQTYFDAEVKPSDFSDPATVGLINAWVYAKTHGKIEEVINGISADAVMYLINAIYFKGTWKYKFDKDKTISGEFYNGNATSTANYMVQEATFKYSETDLLEAIELPYGNSAFSMVVLLPKTGNNVTDVVTNFTSQNWNNWCQSMDSAEVFVKLPKFKFAFDSVINESLKTLGIKKAFGGGDFSNLSDIGVCISKVIHKSFVEVNEEGTEAAAVTVVEFEATSIEPGGKKYFTANRPFVFVLKENTNNTILFAGIVNEPKSE